MPDGKFGVIDLGTNTFHLLIAGLNAQGELQVDHRDRVFVRLGESGLHRIGDAAFERGLQTMLRFSQQLTARPVKQLRALGTAALRTADNGRDFVSAVASTTGIQISLIDGDEEARLIHRGVDWALGRQSSHGRFLIMDIGGGSIEFIIAEDSRVLWAQSFPVGIAVFFQEYQHIDPLQTADIQRLKAQFAARLQPLKKALTALPTHHLVGSSGTFDVLDQLLSTDKPTPFSSRIDLSRVADFSRDLLRRTRAERQALPWMPSERVDMIGIAIVFIETVLEMAGIRELTVSEFALKEGVLADMIETA
jgi:exopolyphosphatase/guanosine-5'-triphosphate,3'-diphosphate pyrophosphatase